MVELFEHNSSEQGKKHEIDQASSICLILIPSSVTWSGTMSDKNNVTDNLARNPQKDISTQCLFATLVTDQKELDSTILLIKSKRAFSGSFSNSLMRVYTTIDPGNAFSGFAEVSTVKITPPETLSGCLFATKVAACRQAEADAREFGKTLIWIDPVCLLLQPPMEFLLSTPKKAAFRPVHISNIGQSADESLNDYWQYIYGHTGCHVPDFYVESFVDEKKLLPYFNSHCFSLDSSLNICETWMTKLETLWQEESLKTYLLDVPQRIFLFQAVMSAVITNSLKWDEIHILPPEYSYPYHLQSRVPPSKRIDCLNDITCVVYEEESIHPDDLQGIHVQEPLTSWLKENL
jgi:hypothetical protein